MKTTRVKAGTIRATSACFLMITALVLNATPAGADPIAFTGSTSIEIPATPGDMNFTLTIDGETHEYKSVDDSFAGTLTLAWAASQTEPRTTVQSCPGGAPGGGILLEEATPSATLWATWMSSSRQALIGPVQVSSKDGFALASVCIPDDDTSGEGETANDPAEEQNEDPAEEQNEDPAEEPEEEPGHGEKDKEKKDKHKHKDKENER